MAHYAPSFPFGHFITPTTDDVTPPISLPPFSRARVSLCDGRAVANKTVDEVGRPISGGADRFFLARAYEYFFFLFSNRYLLSLVLSVSLLRARARPPSHFCGKSYVEFYPARDCSQLNETDRKIRSECVPHFRQSSRIFLISSRSFTCRVPRRVCILVFILFFPLHFFIFQRAAAVKIHTAASRSCV